MRFFFPTSINVVIASFIIQSCLGGIYAWSVYTPPLIEGYHLTAAQLGLIFGLTITSFTISMVGGGRLLTVWSPRACSLACAGLFGGGYWLASFSAGNFWLLLLGAGVMVGAGIGLGYLSAITVCIQWHPAYKGLITGVAVAGFGGGSIIVAFVAQRLIDGGMEVLNVLLAIGAASALLTALAACALRLPKIKKQTEAQSLNQAPLRQLVASPTFIAMSLGMFAGTFGGLLIIANLKPLGLYEGYTSAQSAFAISIFAVGNISGRVLWGAIYDRIGWTAIPLSLLLLGASSLALQLMFSYGAYLVCIALIGFSFGACFVLYAAHIAAQYGSGRVNDLYPIVFLVYGASGVAGPWIGGRIYDLTGSYANAIWLCLAVALPCALASAALLRREKHHHSDCN
ncbi:MAG: MFS transporter [Candidatus Hinthialibacter antarcticus]|nr:MFS transporter [Candidatus Hinthialibacter antarcticus]